MGFEIVCMIFILCLGQISMHKEELDLEIFELLGLTEGPSTMRARNSSSSNSASRFLREVYSEVSAEDEKLAQHQRRKRALSDDSFITTFDRSEIERCNNLITFSSKANPLRSSMNESQKHLSLNFNMNDIPTDLQLVHSTLRLYHDPKRLPKPIEDPRNASISVYEKITFQFGKHKELHRYRIVTSLNMTTAYKGWLEFNITRLLSRWLRYRRFRSIVDSCELLIDVAPNDDERRFDSIQLGLIYPKLNHTSERDPFIVGYFNGPALIEKMRKLRTKREVVNRRRKTMGALHLQLAYQIPKTCERLNFTVNFKDTHMDNWIIAPKKFEAYFCGGECNFPLGSQLNATNHAIVQTLMQLKQPHLPKPCCAPTALESITILHYLNEDNVNLVKFPQSVVKECGCL